MKVIVFDTEATGIDPKKDQIIEAAYCALSGYPMDVLVSTTENPFTYVERFKPDVEISIGAQAVHNIIMSDLADKRHPSTFRLPEGVEYIIGHNIDFDCSMIESTNDTSCIKRICTLALSRFLFPNVDSHKQSAMLYMFAREDGCESFMRDMLKNAHAALDDVMNCTILLRHLMATALEHGHNVDTWEGLYNLSEIARIPTIMGFGKHKGDKISDVPASYVRWYGNQDNTDPYYIRAFKLAGLLR